MSNAADPAGTPYPGQSLGLPETGRGSLASWRARVAALIIDWAAAMGVMFLAEFVTKQQFAGHSWWVLAVFFVHKAILTGLTGSSLGQALARIGVTRTDGQPIGWGRAVARTAMVCLVIPALVVGAERRGLNDLVLGTVVVNRR